MASDGDVVNGKNGSFINNKVENGGPPSYDDVKVEVKSNR